VRDPATTSTQPSHRCAVERSPFALLIRAQRVGPDELKPHVRSADGMRCVELGARRVSGGVTAHLRRPAARASEHDVLYVRKDTGHASFDNEAVWKGSVSRSSFSTHVCRPDDRCRHISVRHRPAEDGLVRLTESMWRRSIPPAAVSRRPHSPASPAPNAQARLTTGVRRTLARQRVPTRQSRPDPLSWAQTTRRDE
jgi:hypothetical protein